MKFYLVSIVFLLASLGFADLAPSNPKVTSKIIFDREYIITETKDPRWLYYDTAYYGRGWFRQKTLNPKNEVDDMKIKADFDTGYQLSDVSVVIEAFDYKRGNKMDCFRDSSPDLTYLIDSCSGNVRIRNLTSEEKEQIQQFKNEFEVTKKPFKIVYDKGIMRTQNIRPGAVFSVTIKPGLEGTLFALATETYDGESNVYHVSKREMAILDRKLMESSFTVEALPRRTEDVDCFGKHPHLTPYSCEGKITIY